METHGALPSYSEYWLGMKIYQYYHYYYFL